jgi:hypothetical protein
VSELTVRGVAMPLQISIDKALVWDRQQTQMVIRHKVLVCLRGTQGHVYAQAGPLYVQTAQETVEAVHLLRARLLRALPGHTKPG